MARRGRVRYKKINKSCVKFKKILDKIIWLYYYIQALWRRDAPYGPLAQLVRAVGS